MSKYSSRESLEKDKRAYYEQLAKTIAVNAKNDRLSDADFRQFVVDSTTEFAAPASNRKDKEMKQ